MNIIIIGLIAAIGAAYLVKKNVIPSITGVTNINGTPVVQLSDGTSVSAASLTPLAPPAPHLKPNAVLLTDNEIAQMNLSIGFSSSDKARFIQQVLKMLPNEQISDPGTALANQCGGSIQYKGPAMAITTLKDGSIALQAASSISSAAGSGFGSASGFAGTGFASAGSTAAKAIPIVGIAIGAAISILSAISAHHAAAVKNEQGLECKLLPPANYSLAVIEQAVMAGELTPQQGQSALATLLSDFKRAAQNGASGQFSEYAGHCNAMCWFYHFLAAIVMKKQNRYSQFI